MEQPPNFQHIFLLYFVLGIFLMVYMCRCMCSAFGRIWCTPTLPGMSFATEMASTAQSTSAIGGSYLIVQTVNLHSFDLRLSVREYCVCIVSSVS